jgi:hypothetical protein
MPTDKPLLLASATIAMCEQVLLFERKRSLLLEIVTENRVFTESERAEFCGLNAEMQAHSANLAAYFLKLRVESPDL